MSVSEGEASRPEAGHRDAAVIRFVSDGARIAVGVNDSDLLAKVQARLPPRSRATAASAVDYRFDLAVGQQVELYLDGSPVSSFAGLAEALDDLEARIDFQVAMAARGKLFVHAGAVDWQGRAIVIPGRTFTGKSRLVLALVQAGATYLSDEFAVFDRRGLVHAWPRALGLRPPGGGPSARIPAAMLGPPAPHQALPVGLVVVTQFRAGARWRPRQRTGAGGVLPLLDNTVMAQARPRFALPTLSQAVAEATVLEGVRGEAEQAARALLRRLSRDRGPRSSPGG